jgi:hypothetical protein
MEKNKYYTPTIEEFHVGFEFEFLKDINYIKEVFLCNSQFGFTFDDFPELAKLSRVKYLDKKDIESLGWKFEKQHPGLDDMTFSKEELTLDFEDIEGIRDRVRIYEFNGDTDLNYFCGTIKNKSELKALMKQLRI